MCALVDSLPHFLSLRNNVIDYITGIKNTHSIYWHSVFRHLQSFLAQPPPALTPMPLLSGTSAMLCNVLTPSTEVWRAKSTPFLLPHPLLGRYP